MLNTLPSTMPERVGVLRASAAFGAVSEAALEALALAARFGTLAAGQVLFAEGVRHSALVLLTDGTLDVIEPDMHGSGRRVRQLGPGEAVDELQTLAGRERSVVVRSVSTIEALVVSGAALDRLCRQHRELRLVLEQLHRRQLLCRLSPVFGAFDRALLDTVEGMGRWATLARGAISPQPMSGVLHLVISGRLQALLRRDDGTDWRVIDEAGRGDALGEHALFNETAPPAWLRAVRDSVLVTFTAAQIEQLIAQQPAMLREVLRLVARGPRASRAPATAACVTNIALVPARPDVALGELVARLRTVLAHYGEVLVLSAERVDALSDEPGLAQCAADSFAERTLLAWLDAQEGAHRFVLYQADPVDTPWTRRCVRMADRTLVVARAGADPMPGVLEQALFAGPDPGAHETLLLLHADGDTPPRGTRAWRLARPRFEDHLHLRWDHPGDFARLGRLLAGRALGVVLGGGGARGFAHIGVLRALQEAGIAVDAVGGTSMGASIAAQYAMGKTPDEIAALNVRVWQQLRPHKTYTLPLLSLVGSSKSLACAQLMYGDTDIEDCWLPFFCVSSNLTTAQMHVHRQGSLRWAATASASIPAFAVPVIEGRQLLVDGGLLNNVPCDVMRELGCGTVIAVKVSPESEAAFTAERVPSPWEVLRSRFTPGAMPVRFPSLFEVAMRASTLTSVHREKVTMADADLCLYPPINRFGLLDFDRLDAIVETGYAYTREMLQSWQVPGSG